LTQEIYNKVIKIITKNSITRYYSCSQIVEKVLKNLRGKNPEDLKLVSASNIYRILSKNSYSNYKHIIKPGLTKAIKKTRKA
jgi:hypothetical protein